MCSLAIMPFFSANTGRIVISLPIDLFSWQSLHLAGTDA
jgi:hypothetical protein